MKLIQISDLHISTTGDIEILLDKINTMLAALGTVIKSGEKVVCFIIGDIINKGENNAYELAKPIIQKLIGGINDIVGSENNAVEILPGNHDVCKGDLQSFNRFASDVLGKEINYSDTNSIYKLDLFGYSFVCISSVLYGETSFGQIDLEHLASEKIAQNSIFITHHALINGDKTDSAAIRDGYGFQTFLEENNALALLHGHTHGCKRYSIGQECQVIGVGPMFKEETDISNQCNLIEINGNMVTKIDTLIYQGDRKNWDIVTTFQKKLNNYYYEQSIYSAYKQVAENTASQIKINNLSMCIEQTYADFEKEIITYFSRYEEDAKKWQSHIVSNDLLYTHSQLMDNNDEKWEEFVISSLEAKPTSKRVIIPLISKEMAYKGGDDKLVSFDIVQFGFFDNSRTHLYITVYMRALETSRFLPINIYEIYLMADQVHKKIRNIENITVCLLAFCAESNDNYGCYKIPQIETLSTTKLCKLLANKDWKRLTELLEEKVSLSDSIIDLKWINNLEDVFCDFYDSANQQSILQQIRKIKDSLQTYKAAREKTSNYAETKKEESEVNQTINTLIEIINKDIE